MDGIEIIVCIGYFSHCCYQIPDKKHLKGRRVYFSLLYSPPWQGWCHYRGMVLCSFILTNQETEKLRYYLSFGFLISPFLWDGATHIQGISSLFRSSSLEMALWTCSNVCLTDALGISQSIWVDNEDSPVHYAKWNSQVQKKKGPCDLTHQQDIQTWWAYETQCQVRRTKSITINCVFQKAGIEDFECVHSIEKMMNIWEDKYVYLDLNIILYIYVLKHQTEPCGYVQFLFLFISLN